MVIFLYGQDTYRSRQKLNEIIEHYQKIHQSGVNLKYFDGKNLNFEDFKDEIQQTSMFKEKKLIILRDIFPNQEFKEKFFEDFKKFIISKDVILFYETSEVSEKDNFLKLLKKSGSSQEFKPLEGEKLKNWLKKEFTKQRREISLAALDKLVSFVGSDSWQLSNEIKKLVSFRAEGEIKPEDVEVLVKPKIETDIFKTIDAVALKNKNQALALIHQHLEKGDSPLYLFSMINFQFRNLLTIKDLSQKYQSPYTLSKITKLHPYIIKKSYSQAKKFTLQELKNIYQKIFEVDLNIKTGKIEPETALDILIAEI